VYSRLLLQIELDVPPRVHNEPACMSASLHICRKAVNCDALQYSMSRPFAQELQSKCLHSSFLNPSCHCLELGDLAVVPLPLEISSSCDLGIAIFLDLWIKLVFNSLAASVRLCTRESAERTRTSAGKQKVHVAGSSDASPANFQRNSKTSRSAPNVAGSHDTHLLGGRSTRSSSHVLAGSTFHTRRALATCTCHHLLET
jgi:hypothetical protein